MATHSSILAWKIPWIAELGYGVSKTQIWLSMHSHCTALHLACKFVLYLHTNVFRVKFINLHLMAELVTNLEMSLFLVLVWVTFLFGSLEFIFVFGTVHGFSFTFHQLASHLSEHWMSVAQSYPTLCNPMDQSLPGPSVHKILQARMLEWVAISFSRSEHYLLNNAFFLLTWSVPSTTYEISQFIWICIWLSILIHYILIHLPYCLNYCSFIICITAYFNFFSFFRILLTNFSWKI